MYKPNVEFTYDTCTRTPILTLELGLEDSYAEMGMEPDKYLDYLHEFILLPSYHIWSYFSERYSHPDVEEYYKQGSVLEPGLEDAVATLMLRYPLMDGQIPMPVASYEIKECLEYFIQQQATNQGRTREKVKLYIESCWNDYQQGVSEWEVFFLVWELILHRAFNKTVLAIMFDQPLSDIVEAYGIGLIREILDLFEPTSYFQPRYQLIKSILNDEKCELLLAAHDQITITIQQDRLINIKTVQDLRKQLNEKDKQINKTSRNLQYTEERLAINVKRLSEQETKATDELTRALKRATGSQYEELQTANRLNDELQIQVKKMQDTLDSYRGYFDAVNSEPNEQENYEEVDFTLALAARVVIIGGHVSWHAKLKQNLPSYRYIDAGDVSFDPNIIRNADVVVVYTKYLSHMVYERTANITRTYKVPMVFLQTLDENILLSSVNDALNGLEVN